jgi:hypothetical protein
MSYGNVGQLDRVCPQFPTDSHIAKFDAEVVRKVQLLLRPGDGGREDLSLVREAEYGRSFPLFSGPHIDSEEHGF